MKDKFLSKAVPRGTRTIWRYLSALFLIFTLGIGQMWAETTTEVYFVKASDNLGTQSTVFTGAPTDGSNLLATFTVDGTDYSCTRRTSNATHSISFSLAANKTARLWAVHNQSGRHYALSGSTSGSITAVTSNTGFSCSTSNAYADVFDISSAETYTLSNSQNIGLVCLILKIDDAGGSVPVTNVAITAPVDGNEYHVGDQVTLAATVLPANATNKTLNWTMDVNDKATISDGKITFTEAGDFHLTATAADGSNKYHKIHLFVTSAPAPSYCAELYPATSGASPTQKNEELLLQSASYGGKIYTAGAKENNWSASFTYGANGLSLNKGGADSARVELSHLMKAGTVIYVKLVNPDAKKARGYKLLTNTGSEKATWQATSTDPQEYTYTVTAGDGLEGTNVFRLQRAESSALKELKVSNCGAELYALSSAVYPAHDPAYATVTLSKTLIAAGGTATATYSAIDPAYDFDEWVINGATIDNAKANPVTITMGSTDATITLKLKAAGVKYDVHFDSKGGSAVADQLVDAGGHASVPTAPTKFKYTFSGWSETDGGSTPADLSAIAINAEKTFYAIWTPKACPTSGTIYSFVSDGTKAPGSNTYCPASGVQGVVDIATYATVSGGLAQAVHTTTSNNPAQIQTSTSAVKLSHADGYFRALLECPLQEGDTIKFVKTNKVKIAFDSLRTEVVDIASGTNNYIVPSLYAGEDTIMVYYAGSSVNLTSLKVVRPAKFDVTFNLHGHGDPIAPQSVLGGGKVTKPSDPSASGWDFGGWYKEAACTNAWDFANDVVSAATELHAKWTVHVAKYTVKYMDGTTELGSEQVNVGSTPAGLASDPEKDCYTFAAWDPALSSVSGTDGQVINVSATWTPRYASSFNFGTTTDLTKDNIATKLDAQNIACSVGAGGSYDNGNTTGYLGYKFKNNGDYIAFLVQEGYEAIVTYGYTESGWTVNGTDAGVATATKAYVDKKYQAPAGGGAKLFKLVNQSADSKTSVLSNIVIQEIPALDNDATLSDLKVGGVTVDGFSSSIHTYHYELPYGTAEADIPAISATAHSAKAKQVAIQQAVWAGDPFNCYRAQANVQAEDESWGYNDVRFSFGPKYGVELIKATHTGEKTATVTGYIGGTYDKNTQGNGKLGSNGHYFGIKLAEGNFQAGDFVEVKASVLEGGNTATMFTDKGETALISGAIDANLKVYRFTLTAETEWIYIYRQSSACNPRVQSIAVYRLMPAFIEEFAITGVEDFVINQENKTITASVANTFDVTSLTPTVKYWGNGGGAIDKTGAQNFTNPVQYTVSSAYAEDATGDYAPVIYTVTINKIAPAETPDITTDPVSANYIEGASIAALSVEASVTDGGTLSYQWYLGDDAIDGATAATYQPTVSAIGSYAYKCVVTNTLAGHPAAEAISAVATIVIAADPACATFAAASIPTEAPYQYTNAGEWTIYNANSSGKRNGSDQVFTNVNDFEGNTVKGFAKERCVLIFEKDMKQVRFYSANAQRAWGETPVRVSDDVETFLGTGTPSYSEYAATTSLIQADPSNNKEQIFIAEGEFLAGKCYWFAFSGSLQIFQICAVEADPKAEAPVFSGALSDEAICPGNTFATLDATASPVTSYAWYKDDEVIENAEAATYTPTEAGTYYCIATNSAVGYRDNSLKSAEAVLSVKAATAITTAPENKRGVADAQVTLSVVATGANLAYAWYTCDDETGANPVAVPAATEASLQVTITAGMHQYYQVVVTGDCGVESAVALVEEWSEVERANVTGSITWDWAGSAWIGISGDIAFANTGVEQLMANVSSKVPVSDAGKFRADMLYGTGQYVWRSGNKFFQGTKIRFITEVPGFLTVHYRNTGGSDNTRKIEVVNNGEPLPEDGTSTTNSWKWTNKVFVQAGEVILNGIASETNGLTRIDQIVFNATPDYERPVSNNIGTLCVDHNVPAGQYFGATFYQIAGRNATYPDKIDFDEVAPSEELKAGEPYIFQSTTGKIDLFYAEGAAVTEPVVVNGMHGVLVAGHLDITEDNMMDVYYISENKLRDCSNLLVDGLNLVANRAYIVMSEVDAVTSAPAPGRRRISIGGANVPAVTTGVENAQMDNAPVKMIINGQLFILRGEKMYDVQGQLVK